MHSDSFWKVAGQAIEGKILPTHAKWVWGLVVFEKYSCKRSCVLNL